MTAVKRLLSTETASVVVRPPVRLRRSASELTSTVWMAATVQMVFSPPSLSYIRFSGFLLGHVFAFPQVSFFTMEHALL